MENLRSEVVKMMVRDLKASGRSYSAIGRGTKLNSSTIQKIIALKREPRLNTFIRVLTYYKKIFAKENPKNKTTQNFYLDNQKSIEDLIYAANLIFHSDGGAHENHIK